MIELEQRDSLELLETDDLLKLLKTMISGGIAISFHGKRSVMEIAKN